MDFFKILFDFFFSRRDSLLMFRMNDRQGIAKVIDREGWKDALSLWNAGEIILNLKLESKRQCYPVKTVWWVHNTGLHKLVMRKRPLGAV